MQINLVTKPSSRLVVMLILVILLAACIAPAKLDNKVGQGVAATSTKITFCYSALSGGQSVAMYAFEKGIFRKYGLDVNFTFIDSGSKAATALIAGDVDFCQIGGAAVISGVVAGEDLVMIGGTVNAYLYSLMVRPEIKTASDLKGKALAISKPGSSSDSATRTALQTLKLQPDKDVSLLSIGEEPARLAAMETGQIAGALVSVPETAKAKAMGYRVLLDMATAGVPFQATSITTTRHYLAAHRENAVNVMKAISEAIAKMKGDQAGVSTVMAKYLLLDQKADAALLDETYAVLVKEYLPERPYPTLEGIQAELTRQAVDNPQAGHFKATDMVDLTILQEIEQSGFIKALYP